MAGKKPPKKTSKQQPFWEKASGGTRKSSGKPKEKKKWQKGASSSKPFKKASNRKTEETPLQPDASETVRLNRFISQAGVCSRREADTLISAGKIKVNGKVVTEMGTRIVPRQDQVHYQGKLLKAQRFAYFLLNKPKNTITTTDDPEGRHTVMDIMASASRERLYPVGRLDRNTTGLLMLTNDGDLSARLTHPSFGVKKVYKVRLNKPVAPEDLDRLREGVMLEDGPAQVDEVDYVADGGPDEVGVVLHIGRNRIVRRLFEHMGYQIENLDRVAFGPLTKKNLPRGKWRELSSKEVAFLKMLGTPKEKKKSSDSRPKKKPRRPK
ncbi:MAG: pseudouridine synthase [Bacteroidota bacterium]